MSAASGRGAVALATAAACAAALLALGTRGGAGDAPTVARLGEIAAALADGARLHPAVAPPRNAEAEAYCAECHRAPAHPGRGAAAAMLNAHAGWMACLACHWPVEGGPRPVPRWATAPGGGTFAAVLAPERASREELARLRSLVAARRVCFERGSSCEGCHRPGGMGPWARPGAPEARAAQLERVDPVFTLAPGEKWYFPQFP